MNRNQKNLLLITMFAKIAGLLFLSFTSDMLIISQLVVVPLLLLESIAVVGYAIESSRDYESVQVKQSLQFSAKDQFEFNPLNVNIGEQENGKSAKHFKAA